MKSVASTMPAVKSESLTRAELALRRFAAIAQSQMNRDAFEILALAELVRDKARKFAARYSPAETEAIFAEADCTRPSDDTPRRDDAARWSEAAHEDVTGLGWSLGKFLGSMAGLVEDFEPGDQADAEAVAVVEAGGLRPQDPPA